MCSVAVDCQIKVAKLGGGSRKGEGEKNSTGLHGGQLMMTLMDEVGVWHILCALLEVGPRLHLEGSLKA